MKTLPEEQPSVDQEVVSKKIEEMLTILENRNKLIKSFYKRMLLPGEKFTKSDLPMKGNAITSE